MGDSGTKAKNKYNAKAYDRIYLMCKKGLKDKIEEAAEKENKSLNNYIIEAVEDKMDADN